MKKTKTYTKKELLELLKDPTNGASGQIAEGYRMALADLRRMLK